MKASVPHIASVHFLSSYTGQTERRTYLVSQPMARVRVIINRLDAGWKHMRAKHVFCTSMSTEGLELSEVHIVPAYVCAEMTGPPHSSTAICMLPYVATS